MDERERELAALLEDASARTGPGRREGVLNALVSTVSNALSLGPDEMAILMLSGDRSMLEFVYPSELAAGGGNRFPLTVPSVAGRVVRTGRNALSNAAYEVPRLEFYERIRIKEQKPQQIQKLLAVGVKGPEGRIRAVIEVSRRGESLGQAGPDFRPEDQQLLERLAAAVAPALAAAFAWKTG